MRFVPTKLTETELELQSEVRAFLEMSLPRGTFTTGLGMDAPRDREFSRELGKRGWLGMTLPKQYGGGERSAVERFVVAEELLRWGAPVQAHWIADRQTGPVINRFGTATQKERFLPQVCSGDIQFAIGMSEPDSGSDLASLRTRATKVDGGWSVSGTKVWTTGAQQADWFLVLCRTSEHSDRHGGLSQLLVDLQSPGVEVRPIMCIDGRAEFNEVKLDDVFVPDDLLLGEPGEGWQQNTSELSYERSGPDRWLSTYLVAEQFIREYDVQLRSEIGPDRLRVIGAAVARWWGIRHLSLSVARMIDAGRAPAVESSLVKDLGTRFEQDVLAEFEEVLTEELDLDSSSALVSQIARCVLNSPSFTIRGGTTEILRSVAARGLSR